MKANHNEMLDCSADYLVVSNGIKDTNLKANHNDTSVVLVIIVVVSNGIKDTNLKANHNSKYITFLPIQLFPMVSKILI